MIDMEKQKLASVCIGVAMKLACPSATASEVGGNSLKIEHTLNDLLWSYKLKC